MIVKKSGASPDQRRKYDEAHKVEALRLASESRSTQAAARQLGSRPKLLYRWQQAQPVAEVGSMEVARAPEVRQLRAMPGATARGACGRAEGHLVGRYALRTWLHRHGLRALSTRSQRPRTTMADPSAVVAENRLLGQPAPTSPHQVWVGVVRVCRWWAGAGATGPRGATLAPNAWWAGPWPRKCPPINLKLT